MVKTEKKYKVILIIVLLVIIAAAAAIVLPKLGASEPAAGNTGTPEGRSVELKNAQVGDIILFGTYEQDNDLQNGAEAIEWLVLDKAEDKILVLSKYALDCVHYAKVFGDVSWEESTLRAWLNGEFIETAFSAEEQAQIADTVILPDSHKIGADDDSHHKAFVLDLAETDKYLHTEESKICAGTPYCYARGARMGENGNCSWWLRPPGYDHLHAPYVDATGSVGTSGHRIYPLDYGTRPAMWLNIK